MQEDTHSHLWGLLICRGTSICASSNNDRRYDIIVCDQLYGLSMLDDIGSVGLIDTIVWSALLGTGGLKVYVLDKTTQERLSVLVFACPSVQFTGNSSFVICRV